MGWFSKSKGTTYSKRRQIVPSAPPGWVYVFVQTHLTMPKGPGDTNPDYKVQGVTFSRATAQQWLDQGGTRFVYAFEPIP